MNGDRPELLTRIKRGICNVCDMNGDGTCINDDGNDYESCIYANEIADSVYEELFCDEDIT